MESEIFSTVSFCQQMPLPACDSEIFCHGPLLEAAQQAHIYNDSKSFVDMKLEEEPSIVLSAFQLLNESHGGHISDDQMKEFINEYFSPPGSECLDWTPEDWQATPAFLSSISDVDFRAWASKLNDLWKVLGRKMVGNVKENSSLYSVIPIDNPVIVPGGRFREVYYWDTYWIIRGLIVCEMTSTVRGMLFNFISMVERFGFVPNGGRIYYQRRSQPPFLIPMVHDYVAASGDEDFLKSVLPVLDSEYSFWINERSVTVNNHTLNRYASDVNQPRPESYREDKAEIQDLPDEKAATLMTHITSACESGWDFSTRWTGLNYNDKLNVIGQLQTRDIIPVDLNSVLALNERFLAEFHRNLGNQTAASVYEENYRKRTEAIEALLWNEADGVYYDFIISSKEHNREFYASNLNPLWTKCYPENVNVTKREERLYRYLQQTGVLHYPGGIPTSLRASGQQWDFPNAWPPLVHLIIEGLSTSEIPKLEEEARVQAQKWIRSNYKAYVKTNAMFEKYDVTQSEGVPGNGGEYDVQTGFGWTNGVILSFLSKYGNFVTAMDEITTTEHESTTHIAVKNDETTNSAARATYLNFIKSGLLLMLLVLINFATN